MARLNIEERCFGEGRLFHLGLALGGDERLALGTLGFLWHDSQELCKPSGTRKQIAMWCRERDPNKWDALIQALVELEYISQVEGQDLFRIHGNRDQIENRLSSMKKAKKGGRATYEKWKRLNEGLNTEKAHASNRGSENSPEENNSNESLGDSKREESQDDDRGLEACQTGGLEAQQYKAIQGNTRQGNTTQEKKNSPPDPGEPGTSGAIQGELLGPAPESTQPGLGRKRQGKGKDPTPTWKVWCAYVEAYRVRYPKGECKWSATTAGQITALIRLVGFDDALAAVKHYLTMSDRYYLQNYHPIGLKQTEWHRIVQSMKQGKSVSADEAAALERDQRNRQAVHSYWDRKYGPKQGGS